MCGICGTFAYGPNGTLADHAELVRVRDAMRNRGPDAEGIWISGNRRVGLGHRRLSIIDLSPSGGQPMIGEDCELVVVFNGEIYNYAAIRTELESKGYRFRSHSDTEVLLHLYRDRGNSMVERLRGMYAFAIWDQRNRGLFMARDPFGIKPFYYADDGHTVKFASQVKALLAGLGGKVTPDPAGHIGFFLWGHVPEPHTLYREIKSLEAGSTLWIDSNGKHTKQRFWNIPDSFTALQTRGVRQASLEELREALVDSVRHHLVADVPVGVFLSSGLDSSTLAALASEISGQSLVTITLGFEEFKASRDDECLLAEKVARQYGTRHHTEWISIGDFHSSLNRILETMDQPTVDGVNTYFVSKVAAGAGLKVAISGLGGDELFGGYASTFQRIPKMVRVLRPFGYAPFLSTAFRIVTSQYLRRYTHPKTAGLLEYGGRYETAYMLSRGLFMPWELPGLLDADFVRAGWRELQPIVNVGESIRGITSARMKVSAMEMSWYMKNQLLRDTDWSGMAHSLEIRVPLVDSVLFGSVVGRHHHGMAWSKRDMARTPKTPLPPEIINRDKTGFSVPVKRWMQTRGLGVADSTSSRGWARYVYGQFTNGGAANDECAA